ncbi:class III chitinase, putative [Paecilomyces variotii No. 5]|uniref:chitinase n=1 Tax=Byssochlamys spectabilis (strain No. 5 / NBRC 109023) TaxID=1356009 RepID=V5FAR6_BYSSN|nr:class III chitinase, putative [Paecilomyces variotii No. 5]
MPSFRNALAAAALLASSQGAYAKLDTSSSTNVAVYWGQNSYDQSSGSLAQQPLAYYCDNDDIDVLQLAFLTVINGQGGAPEINFSNSGNNCTTFSGTDLLNCPQIGADIATCQSKGKTILLSIGGATYTEGGFTSESAAVAGANLIWETFGPKSSNSSANRPFGDSVVDGFDFDFESTVSNMAAFGNQLRSLMDSDTSKQYFLTAAPQCVYPDAADNQMLDGAVSFDAIWVQFYNNYCGVNSYTNSSTQNSFNFDTWDNWAKTNSKNKDVKVFLGVPANTGAAGTGYLPASSLAPVINYCKTFSSFGGVMMWDASQAYANNGFISSVKSTLTATVSRIMRRVPLY